MAEGIINADIAAQLLGITPKEVNRLASDGIVPRAGPNQFPLIGLVKAFVGHLRNEITRMSEAPTQKEIADALDMSERNVRDVLAKVNIDHRESTLRDITIAYIRLIREQAAGRGGESQFNLTAAKAEESIVKTASLRLGYNREIGKAIYTEDAAAVLEDWARYANREYIQGIHMLVSEIQSEHGISVNQETVEDIAGPTTERIKGHAGKLGRDLVARIEHVLDTETAADS